MKHCDLCDALLKDDAAYCPYCGNTYNSQKGNRLHVSDIDKCAADKNQIEHIEQQVANYYNNTYLGSKSGKYVVLHNETTVSGNVCNIVVRYQDGKGPCCNISYTPIADVAVNMITGECSIHSKTVKPVKRDMTRNWTQYLCLFLLAGCIFLWLLAPFAAMNIGTLKDQPTTLQIIREDILFLGEKEEYLQYWVALISIIGIAICIISTIAAANKVTCIVAILTELPMIYLMKAMYDSLDVDDIMDALGVGFWGIFYLLLIVVCVTGINLISDDSSNV